jgi:phosphatidylinositol 4-kinase B
MPMWCLSSDTPSKGSSQHHHRIVRIPPGESVVLNSAERAPYLLLVEILNDDLDFDPTKRGNKEVLKKIVTKENERQGASRDLSSFGTPTITHRRKPMSLQTNVVDTSWGEVNNDTGDPPIVAISPTSPGGEEEEMDLVEQLYGSDLSLRSQPIDLSDSVVLRVAPKNKELDMVTWSRSSSIPSSPVAASASTTHLSVPSTTKQADRQLSTSNKSLQPASSTFNSRGQILSLDDYSDRMRTAAIMLAQLNANLVREPMTTISVPNKSADLPESLLQPGSIGWFPASSWLGISLDQNNSTARGPVHPSLAGGPTDTTAATQNISTRLKLQHSEAAAIRDRIMKEMLDLEEERMKRMRENREWEGVSGVSNISYGTRTAEDEGIIRRELNKADPSAVVFSESWAAKKAIPSFSYDTLY